MEHTPSTTASGGGSRERSIDEDGVVDDNAVREIESERQRANLQMKCDAIGKKLGANGLPRRRNGKQQVHTPTDPLSFHQLTIVLACEPCRKAKIACDHSLPVCEFMVVLPFCFGYFGEKMCVWRSPNWRRESERERDNEE